MNQRRNKHNLQIPCGKWIQKGKQWINNSVNMHRISCLFMSYESFISIIANHFFRWEICLFIACYKDCRTNSMTTLVSHRIFFILLKIPNSFSSLLSPPPPLSPLPPTTILAHLPRCLPFGRTRPFNYSTGIEYHWNPFINRSSKKKKNTLSITRIPQPLNTISTITEIWFSLSIVSMQTFYGCKACKCYYTDEIYTNPKKKESETQRKIEWTESTEKWRCE